MAKVSFYASSSLFLRKATLTDPDRLPETRDKTVHAGRGHAPGNGVRGRAGASRLASHNGLSRVTGAIKSGHSILREWFEEWSARHPNGRVRVARLAGLVLALSSLPFVASAQEDVTHCSELLAVPPLHGILTDGDAEFVPSFSEISSHRMGSVLLGTECDEETLTAFFAASGWEFRGRSKGDGVSEFGPPDARYRTDLSLAFCKPKARPWRWIFNYCRLGAGVSLLNGRITHIRAGLYK